MANAAIKNAWRNLRRLQTRRGAYRKLFLEQGLEGQRVLEDLMEFCGASEPSYRLGDSPTDAAHREGMRKVWLHIQYLLNLSDHQIALMQREIAKAQEADHDDD